VSKVEAECIVCDIASARDREHSLSPGVAPHALLASGAIVELA
jgi:hypothetical protein